jgi:hypothetical protein
LSVLRGIVKDDPERMSMTLTKFTDSMAKGQRRALPPETLLNAAIRELLPDRAGGGFDQITGGRSTVNATHLMAKVVA